MCARGELVDQAGYHFLSRAAFSQHKNWNIDVRYQRRLRTYLAHGRTGGDEKDVVVELLDFALISLFVHAQALVYDGVELGFLKRLGQVIMSAEADSLNNFAGIADAGEHDH